MAETIRLRCCCGAEFEMGCSTYICGGGKPDERGRRYIAEVRADEWQERHRLCSPPQIGGWTVPMLKPGPVTCESSEVPR